MRATGKVQAAAMQTNVILEEIAAADLVRFMKPMRYLSHMSKRAKLYTDYIQHHYNIFRDANTSTRFQVQ